MRISTNTIYEFGVANLQQQTAKLTQVQQQLGSNRRLLTPADDPSAAARVLEISQSQAITQQYSANIGAAGDSLAFEESTLKGISDLLQSAKEVASAAGNAGYSQSDRRTLASELRGQYQQLLGLANSTDSSGQYLFAGHRSATAPFSQASPGVVTYNGDQGQRLIQVGPTRQIEVSDSGDSVFVSIPAGNGNFVTKAGADNTGTGLIDTGNTLDAAAWKASSTKNFSIVFSDSTNYDIFDDSGNQLVAGGVYASGDAIDLPGAPPFAQVTVSGTPAAGDSFTVAPSASQDVFKTMNDLADLLESGVSGTARANELSRLQRDLDNAFNNAISVRAGVGTRMKELDSLKVGNEDLGLQYSQSLSRLQDLDYAKAASEFTQQQITLQAAQQSFVKVASLSLFNYL